MDLSTMTVKIAQGLYKNRFEFEADFRLMVNNAKQYNASGSYVHNEAIALETIFEKSKFSRYLSFRILINNLFTQDGLGSTKRWKLMRLNSPLRL